MQKIGNFLGLSGGENQPTRYNFSQALIWFPFVTLLTLGAALYKMPAEGVPSQLAALNPEIPGGANWIPADRLSAGQVSLHWFTYFLPYVVYLCAAVLLTILAIGFYRNGRFTRGSRLLLKVTLLVCLLGILLNQLLLVLSQKAALEAYGIADGDRVGFLTGDGALQFFVLALLVFIDATIMQGADLLEEADATI